MTFGFSVRVVPLALVLAAFAGCEKDPCPESCECGTLGRCTKNPKKAKTSDASCIPRGDADCKASDICAKTGACTAKGDKCIVTSDADCKQSKMCKTLGACTFVDDRCTVTEKK